MFELEKWIIAGILMVALALAAYFLGRSHAQIKYIEKENREIVKQVEIVKYVEKQKQKIYAAPHINRDTALKLFESGIL